ncbi:MAG: hypothetical protein LQ351_002009 [Letrouitia transgressa]|nr:MAG: hypothetical protein LQ351_002009 [Letrouitia transgressa]
MSKSILDFFKPFAQPRQDKRPLSEDSNVETRPAQRSRSSSPPLTAKLSPQARVLKANQTDLVSSQCSALSSLPRSTPSAPDIAPNNPSKDHPTATTQSDEPEFPSSSATRRSSSQRIVKNGEVVITDSDDEQYESDSSLEDLNNLLAPRRSPGLTTPTSRLEDLESAQAKPSNGATDRKRGRPRRASPTTSPAQPPNPPAVAKYKFSLNTLLQQSLRDDDSHASITKAKSLLASLDGNKDEKPSLVGEKIDTDLLSSMVDRHYEEGGDLDRLMLAIQRTEAFHQKKSWSFFEDMMQTVGTEPPAFPSIQDSTWTNILGGTASRQQAFVSGYVGDLAMMAKLPSEAISWIIDSAYLERRDDLRYSYCQTLRDIGCQVTHLVDPARLNQVLRRIGAREDALDLGKAIVPVIASSKTDEPSDFTRLLPVLDMLNAITDSLTNDSKIHIICLLCRILLDRAIIDHCRVQIDIEDLLSRLIDNLDALSFDQIVPDLVGRFRCLLVDPILRLKLLQGLPMNSVRTSLFRRRLALAFFFEDDRYLSENASSLISLKAIASHLRKPQFNINNETFFPELAASISILAIGIDDGDPPAAGADNEIEEAFNKEVDMLSAKVKAIYTQIVDTGASHMRRTEAKEVLEAFHSRLEYAVRTKPKAKNTLLGDWEGERDVQKQAALMKNHFTSRKREEESPSSE